MSKAGAQNRLVIGHDRMELVFSRLGSLVGLFNRQQGFGFPLSEEGTLWQVILRSPEGHSVVIEPTHPPAEVKVSADRLSLSMEWRERANEEELCILVQVRVDPAAPLARWRCEVHYGGPCSVWEVTCPRLAGLGRIAGDGSGDRLAIPWQYGGLVPNPIQCLAEGGSRAYGISMDYGFYDAENAIGKKQSRIAYSYPGMWSLQFMAFYNPSYGGLYLGAHDPTARYKRFGLYSDMGSDQADLVMQHYPDERLQAGLDYSTPYDTVVALFRGEWWEASRIYRQWALEQEWCRLGPLAQRRDLPQWLLDTDLWYWNWMPNERLGNHGRAEHLVPAILDLKERLGANLAFHWYEWDDRKFNDEMPEVFPLAPAAMASLKAGIDWLHRAGVRAIPYINARLWSTNHPTWASEGAPLACRTPGGQVAWYDNMEGWAQICPFTRRWQAVVREMCDRILDECGLDGAYLDQITSCYVVPCFAEGHGHPRGGGNSWYVGYREMMTRIQGETKKHHPEAVFTSESTIDCYLDLFDANLAREASELSDAHSDQWLPIPLFHSVYHDYAITYGTVLRLIEQRPEAYYYGEALVLTGGQQLMVEDYMAWDVGTDHYADYLSYLRKLVQVRRLARFFLLFGRWMPPLDLHTDQVEVHWSSAKPPKAGIPAVLNSVWHLDGALCLVLVNHTDQPRAFEYSLSIEEYSLGENAYALRELTEQGEIMVGETQGGLLRGSGTVGPRSPKAFVVRPIGQR